MTKSELAQLAIDIVDDKIFGSWSIIPDHLQYLERIFVPLQKGRDCLPKDVCCLYEYKDKAWPLCIEGYPVFFSMKYLTHSDRELLAVMIGKARSLRDALIISLGDCDEDHSVVDTSVGGGPEASPRPQDH